VVGPVAVFFAGLSLLFATGIYERGVDDYGELMRGWGVPTATDIALAWLTARAVFGAGHPAINFLLLLAVADDAIGLAIIAIFYGDPQTPAEPAYLALVGLGMAIAFGLRRANVRNWIPYIAAGGPLCWAGLSMAHLHPALALVCIVPFLPGPLRDTGLFMEEVAEVDGAKREQPTEVSPLEQFEHQLKLFVDLGLFFFAFTQAGVAIGEMGPMTWLVLVSLVVGKTAGISVFAWAAVQLGFPLPDRMGHRELVMAGYIAALGMTVALFVASVAFLDPGLLAQAKMGALLSGLVGVTAVGISRLSLPSARDR
jgi:Na+:H+ antiporter, NhaA family